MPTYRYTACQLLELFKASRLNADAWTTAIELGIAAKLPTRRGCRGGVRKQRTIQPVIGHRPPTRQAIPTKQTGVDSSNLVQQITPVSALDSCTAATLGLLNVRSLRNKADFITDYACENDIDILCLTETWLTDNDASLISAIVPHGYKFQHLPRNDRRVEELGFCSKLHFTLHYPNRGPPNLSNVSKSCYADRALQQHYAFLWCTGHHHLGASLSRFAYS